jgi:glycosyltransferase involved in cell wall biosynthesis
MPNFIIGIARSLSPKVPIILDMHDLMSVNFMTKFKSNCFAGQVIAYEEKWSISKATKLVCADRGQKQVLTRLHYNKDPIVIMNLADEDLFRWSDHSWIGGPFRFVYHGTIAWRLGVDRVIEALRNLPEHIVFRLIGDGDEKESIVNMIHAYSLNNRVEVLPIVPVEELPGLLSDCHAGVIPSRRTEATNSAMLPVKLLEYTSLGIPSVVSKLDNISLHFREDQAAFFQPESQTDLKRAMSEITISKTMRSRILRGIQDFNIANRWQHGAETYMRVVNEITS